MSRDLERGAGWFWLGLAGKSYESDQLDAAYLAPAEGSEQHKYQLIVHLVWGPPGTGKTRVIALRLQDLINSRKSVLLVSGTNVAVDNALDRAFQARKPAPGVMIRVGNPHLPETAANSAVCLQTLVRERQEALQQQRLELETQISVLHEHPVIGQLAEAQADLEGFNMGAFLAAGERLALARKIADTKRDLDRLTEVRGALQAATAASASKRDDLLAVHQAAATARSQVAAAREVQQNLAKAEEALLAAEANVIRLQNERDNLTNDLETAKAARRFGHGRQKGLVKNKEREQGDDRHVPRGTHFRIAATHTARAGGQGGRGGLRGLWAGSCCGVVPGPVPAVGLKRD